DVVVQCPSIHIVKTANPAGPVSAGSDIGFDITGANSGARTAAQVTVPDSVSAGGDLNWALNPAFVGCAITGPVGTLVLDCTFASIASGGSVGPIHVQSATTAVDCSTVHNTAAVYTLSLHDALPISDVVVQCPSIHIVKTANPAGPVSAGSDIGF